MNELLSILTLILSFILVIVMYKYLGKMGLFLWICLSTIIANIESVKLITLFGIETSLGNILYGSTFLATDIINVKYGEKEAKKTILVGFISMMIMTLFMTLCLLYSPSINDFSQESLKTIFTVNIRVSIASIIAFSISQLLDARLFQMLHKKYNKLWLSNNASTMISQIVDTIIFSIITYYGLVSNNSLIQIIMSMYLFKFIIALCDTPFIYMANKIKNVKEY